MDNKKRSIPNNNNELNTHKSSSRKSLNKNYKSMNLFQFPQKRKSISSKSESFKNKNSIKKTRNIHQKKVSYIDSKTKQPVEFAKISIFSDFPCSNAKVIT